MAKNGFLSRLMANAGGDIRAQAVAKAIPVAEEYLMKLIPKRYYYKYFGNHRAFWEVAAPFMAFAVRSVTKLPPGWDGFVTEAFQEMTQTIELLNLEYGPKTKPEFQLDSAEKIFKTFLSADKADVDDLFKELNRCFDLLDDDGKMNFLRTMSKLNSDQIRNFIDLDVEEKKKVFAVLYPKFDDDTTHLGYTGSTLDKLMTGVKKAKEVVAKTVNTVNDWCGDGGFLDHLVGKIITEV